jgi:nitrogen-specific signal transduction histidine kinase/ActR/RegA family two-component response regulator
VIETVNNITEKYLLEDERLKTQKLEAIGTLAGGIAHDFNNLLQGIFGYISMAKITLDQNDNSFAMLEQAEQALHLSVNLTTQLLTFSKGGKPLKKKISLRPVIENSVRFALSGSSVDYRIRLDEDLWLVDADEGQIGQVVQNIVLNADQAMPLGGTIVIAAKNVLSSDSGLPHLPGEGKYIGISVADSGIGISEKYLEKIFDPYFTTKEKGSGLGLATSYSIIKNHGGIIDVKSGVDKGTTFYIYLPAVESDAEVPQVPKVSVAGRKGKILIMDDEELVRNVAGALVKVLGNEVEVVEHGEAAIAKYMSARESGKPFDIVILDLTIREGLGGRETIERLLAIDPGVRAIVSSGYSDNAVVADYQNYGFKAALNKPYKLEELRNTLNALFNG